MKYKIITFLSFLILTIGCTAEDVNEADSRKTANEIQERSKLQTKLLLQNKNMNELNEVIIYELNSILEENVRIYQDFYNKHSEYVPYGSMDEKTFLDVEKYFYDIYKKIKQAENLYSKFDNPDTYLISVEEGISLEGHWSTLTNSTEKGWMDGWYYKENEQILTIEQWFSESMRFYFMYMSNIGYNLIDLDLMDKDYKGYDGSYDYDTLLEDYITIHYEALKYCSINEQSDRIYLLDSFLLRNIMYVGWGFDNYKILEDFYTLLFDLYDNEDVFDYEIKSKYVRYFDHIVDYIQESEVEDVFRIHNKGLKEIGNQFNKLSNKYLRSLNENNLFDIVRPDNLLFNDSRDVNDNKNIINITSFIINGKIADKMMTRGYPEDAVIFLERAINSFNVIDIASFSYLSSDYYRDEIYFEFLSSYTNIINSINIYSKHILMENGDENFFKENINTFYSSINRKEEFKKFFDSQKPPLLPNVNTFSLGEAMIAAWIKYPNANIFDMPKDVIERLDKLSGDIYETDKRSTAKSVEENLSYVNKYPDTESIIEYLASLQAYLFENFDYDVRNYNSSSEHHQTLLLAYKPQLENLFDGVYLSDIQDNPESYASHIGLLKEFIIGGYALDLFDFNTVYRTGSMNESNMRHLIELCLIDKLQNLLEVKDEGQTLFLDYFLDIKDEYINNEYYINNLISFTDINIVYTAFSMGYYRNIFDYAFYTISSIDNSLKIEKVKYFDLSEDMSINTETFVYDIERLNFFIEEKRNIDSMQQIFYNTLFKPIKSNLKERGPIVFILDPIIETFPWEALINPLEDDWWKGPMIKDFVDDKIDKDFMKSHGEKSYLFETNAITRASSLLDFFNNTDYLIRTKNNQAQRLNNFQNFLRLTDDIYTPRLLAVGGVDYNKERKNYDITRGNKTLSNLPWSLNEVISIDKSIRNTTLIKGKRATETLVKSQNFSKFE